MNQGKLEVVKQEMARVNVDILGISELKWTEMGEFNSDVHMKTLLFCCWKRVFAMTSVFPSPYSISLSPASFCTPRPNLPVTPGIS